MKQIKDLSPRQLAAQCIIPRLWTDKYYEDKEYKSFIQSLVKEGIGGFCLFNGDLKQVYNIVAELQSMALIPLIFCGDFEYGLPMRFSFGTEFPHAMALGKADNPEITKEVAKAIAWEAKTLGITWNLSPVCDINSNRENPIINIRAFGEDKENVIAHSAAYISGTQGEKVLACAKHFPGHGDTTVDSHLALPVVEHCLDRINEIELEPFRAAIEAGVKSIMVAHLSIPVLDNNNLPATLSRSVITGMLRENLKYKGLIITDAMDMNAIKNNYSSGEAAVLAAKAGINIILMPDDVGGAINSLTAAAEKDSGLMEHLINSTRLLDKEKKWCGLSHLSIKEQETGNLTIAHEKLALNAALKAVKIKGNDFLIPLPTRKNIAGFAFLQSEEMEPAVLFFKILAQAIENDCDFAFINENINDKEIEDFQSGTKDADLLLFAFFYRARAYKGKAGFANDISRIIKKLKGSKPAIAILFGNPYIEDNIQADTFIYTYTDSLPGIAASILVLSGRSSNMEQY